MIPIIFSYAEVHYALGPLRGLYYRRMPEIVADLPHRYIRGSLSGLPVALIVKDANRWPLRLLSLTVHVHSDHGVHSHQVDLHGHEVRERYHSSVVYVPLEDIAPDQALRVNVRIEVELRGRRRVFYNDNYRGLLWEPFDCWYAAEGLPLPTDWYAGDAHYHSHFTDDQVEFGADPATASVMARALGLRWFFVTDHSYDLDDAPGNPLRQDPAHPKWGAMMAACRAADTPDVRVLWGEEISVGNSRGQNVHLLAINDPRFHLGSGDSAERWFRNRPELHLSDIARHEGSLLIPAHPFDPVPPLQRLTLRRGQWADDDFQSVETQWLQAINGGGTDSVRRNLDAWRETLLAGRRRLIVAGNDAHGNFGCMRQIAQPMLRLFRSREQIFGDWFTAFRHTANEPVAGLEGREIIVSNGPFLMFRLQGQDAEYRIGQEMRERHCVLHFEYATTPQFGAVRDIELFIGDVRSHRETLHTQALDGMKLLLPPGGYVRMELHTERGGHVVTNPVFLAEDA
ncbi:MAG: CehA/McbA family metallohydrolase [Candidatus Cloacimonetes bacterium]|nr:CehA/McbA family metallohydrolase [Candidatus Cloacimonadota bacterium]